MSGQTQRTNAWTVTIEGYTTAATAIQMMPGEWAIDSLRELLGIEPAVVSQSVRGTWEPDE